MSSDSPPSTPKGKDKEKDTDTNPQLIFGIDATLTSALNITTHTSNGSTTQTKKKGEHSLPSLRDFLSHLPTHITFLEPSLEIFKSACPTPNQQSSSPGVEAYRGAKAGTLWFFAEGILYGESKPCEFWALQDLVGKEDGLRLISATGRTCSVILSRKIDDEDDEDDAMDEGDDEAVEEGVETEFGMIDGKEQEGIRAWVKRFKHLFGKKRLSGESGAKGGINGSASGTNANGPNAEAVGPVEDSDDEDSDFTSGSEEDLDGSESESDSDEDSGGEDGEGEARESGEEGAEDDGEGDEEGDAEEEELDPKHHPLLRPGAMPKMSKAAMSMAVGIVEQDMGMHEDDEEDELED